MTWLLTRTPQHCILSLLVAASVFSFIGCGGTGEGLGSVTGTVTLNGEPLSDAVVEYSPAGGEGSMAMGRTDQSGHYEMMFTMNQKGATLGENTVTISTADAGLPDGNGKNIQQLVPAKYNTRSTLVAAVKEGANVIDFDLDSEDDSVIVQPKLEL